MPRLSYGKRNAIRQAHEMQKLCFSGAELLGQDLRASQDKYERARIATAIVALARNWTALLQRADAQRRPVAWFSASQRDQAAFEQTGGWAVEVGPTEPGGGQS